MDCLIDYIGIRTDPEGTVPESGLYINSLPGISIETIGKSGTTDQADYEQVWADAQTEAAARFEVDVLAELSKCYKLSAYCDYEEIICNNKRKLANAWKFLLGNQLMLFRIYSTRLNRFTTVTIESAKELAAFYQVEYESNLKQSVLTLDVSSCECLECGGIDVQTTVWLP